MATPSQRLERIFKGEAALIKIKDTSILVTQETKPKINKNSAAMVVEASKTEAATTDMGRLILADRIMMIGDKTMMTVDRIMVMVDRIMVMVDRIMVMVDRITVAAIRMEECLTWSSSTCSML